MHRAGSPILVGLLAQSGIKITGGEQTFVAGGALVALHGSRYDPAEGWSPPGSILNILFVVPGHRRRGSGWGGGPDHRYSLALMFRLPDGTTVRTDTLLLVDGRRLKAGDTSFDLAQGNFFVVRPRDGRDSVYQLPIVRQELLETAARLSVFQEALPHDSLIEALRPPGSPP